jgi:hypothetical protein
MKEVAEMCKSKSIKGCEHPERLKGKPEECSPEQIKECHGEVVEHPCAKGK